VTVEEKEEQLLQAMKLGRVFPLWGVVADQTGELRCECGDSFCKDAGKHPRLKRKLASQATDNPTQVREWLARYPNANFAVYTGERCIVVDADVRAGKPNGLQSLEFLEIDNGERIPFTVTVLSGRNNGSSHLYFRTPPNFTVNSRGKFLPGVDLKAHNQYVVAPGSRHIAGGCYRFSEECGPDEQAVADLPAFLLDEILRTRRLVSVPRADVADRISKELVGRDLPEPGVLRSDAVVLGALRHDAVAGPLYRGELRFPHDLSRNDIALADKICFYSCHNFAQALRLFLASGLYRDKFERPANKDWTYAAWTLRKAFLNNPNNWIPKPRKSRATGAKKGRKPSESTIAVVNVHNRHPNWRPCRIASALAKPAGTVRRILHGLRRGRYSDLERYTMENTRTQI
jgi:Bifunctional DNA primase/polymerase, N-terminal